jgi:hypothetical protein
MRWQYQCELQMEVVVMLRQLPFVLLALSALCACDHTPFTTGGTSVVDASTGPKAVTGVDIASLEKIIALPRRPEKVQWRKAILGEPGFGPTDWSLLAVMDFKDDDKRALLVSAKRQAAFTLPPDCEAWLPTATRDALRQRSDSFSPEGFVRSPLLHGSLAYVPGTGQFVLYLHTM